MKNSTSLERSKLQLTMMARLHDVFADIKDEVEITPEYIQETLGQFMQVATGSDYPFSKSVRIGFGDLVQAQPQVQVQSVVDSVEKALNGTMSKTSDKLLHNTEKTLQEVLSFVRNTFESKLFEFNQQHLLNTEGVSSSSVCGVGELKIFKHGIYVGDIAFEFADQ
ncbi:hypothetical protein [Xenorhabdus thuongxuanensis]|uniref:Uncharacterized protein n=1 Tax=Xenorhabdus thuongxuanensis TaxID=1873484 RepID=A0A1Q5U3V7_9GAMM|nr:hypothetical protein [Xenorhabdus thuongxuanensis]OKP07158.1 hypothetical protein Xentx_01427 [Xenorhabdus thuongxuanensis]